MSYTVASFFSGIGGIDLAFAWAGFDIRFQCEIDPYCQQVLKKWRPVYWQNAVVKGDIRAITKREVGKVDVIVGGFPCQDISIAGKREGIRRGNRSGLWFELLRIIGEVRPKVVLLENVAAIAVPVDGQPAPGLIVAATLAEIGYDCQWQFVRAADVDAPHQRERWFCVGYERAIRDGMDNPNSTKLQTRGRRSGVKSQNAAPRHSSSHPKVVNTPRKRQQKRGEPHSQQTERVSFSSKGSRRAMGITDSVRYKRQGRDTTRGSTATITKRQTSKPQYATRYKRGGFVKSRLGRVAHGVSRRLDRHNGQFPARPNEPQHAYEPSRVTDVKENRVARIKALGNAVVPQVVYPFAVAIKEFLGGVSA